MGHSWRSYLAVLLANATMLAATVSLLISIARTGTLVTKYRETLVRNTTHPEVKNIARFSLSANKIHKLIKA